MSIKVTSKILSWDVGIKNLAYCMLEKSEEDFKILQWGIINLVEDRQKCEHEMKAHTCEEVAKFLVYHTDKINLFDTCESKFSCSKHKDKMTPKIIDTKDKNHICMICEKQSDYLLENTKYSWCKTHFETKGKSFVKKIKSKKVSVTSCNKQPIQELAEKLFSKLDKEFDNLKDIDKVLIENQPSFINPTMKTLSAFLYSYFVVRGITDGKMKSDVEVKFVSPSNKLKVNENNTDNVLKGGAKEKIYKMTKKLGVKYCTALICEKDKLILEKYKKKDDMCDSFLQGFQHLFPIIPKKYFDMVSGIGFEEEKSKKVKETNEDVKEVKPKKKNKKEIIVVLDEKLKE